MTNDDTIEYGGKEYRVKTRVQDLILLKEVEPDPKEELAEFFAGLLGGKVRKGDRTLADGPGWELIDVTRVNATVAFELHDFCESAGTPDLPTLVEDGWERSTAANELPEPWSITGVRPSGGGRNGLLLYLNDE